MIAAQDTLALALGLLGASTQAVVASTARLRSEVERCVARDSVTCPPPARIVLVVHDEPSTLWALASTIAAALGVPVLSAETIAEARVQMRQRPAVIVSDYHLGAGETCAALLRDRPAWMRALIVTGRADPEALASIAAGCGAHVKVLSTPVTEEERATLITSVRRELAASA